MSTIDEKAVSLDTLSHFKAKQDLYNANTFQKKGESDLTGTVRYDAVQVLTEEQKAQARANIGAGASEGTGSAEGSVRYDAEQALDEDDKARARANIGTTDGTWENMPDKPFGCYTDEARYPTITWDGNKTGKVCVEFTVGGMTGTFVKVADDFAPYNYPYNVISSYYNEFKISMDGEINDAGETEIEGDTFSVGVCTNRLVEGLSIPLIIYMKENYTVFRDTQFSEEGVYFLRVEPEVANTEHPIFTSSMKAQFTKTISKDFLPDDVNAKLPEGIVTTDENGLIPASLLPSYVDDVIEGYYVQVTGDPRFEKETPEGGWLEITPESGKIYVDLNTGNTYRWSGTVYVRLNPDEITFATTGDIDELFN